MLASDSLKTASPAPPIGRPLAIRYYFRSSLKNDVIQISLFYNSERSLNRIMEASPTEQYKFSSEKERTASGL